MIKRKNQIDGYIIYQIGNRGCCYNPSLKFWELYEMDEEGTIQDNVGNRATKAQAMAWIWKSDSKE